MDIFEEAVMEYLTHDGDVFVCPQYRANGANPDFVALNFTKHQIEVVEVNGGQEPQQSLAPKVNDRKWVNNLVAQLREKKVIDGSWKRILRVFIIKAKKEQFCKKIVSPHDVLVETIDDVFACLLDWQKRREPEPCNPKG
jgi:hypothetical protein